MRPQEMDTIVNTIQETWDSDADARLLSQCVYEWLATFAREFEFAKDSDFSPLEFDTAEMSEWVGPTVSRHYDAHNYAVQKLDAPL